MIPPISYSRSHAAVFSQTHILLRNISNGSRLSPFVVFSVVFSSQFVSRRCVVVEVTPATVAHRLRFRCCRRLRQLQATHFFFLFSGKMDEAAIQLQIQQAVAAAMAAHAATLPDAGDPPVPVPHVAVKLPTFWTTDPDMWIFRRSVHSTGPASPPPTPSLSTWS